MDDQKCACPHPDSYQCWRWRYVMPGVSASTVERNGGPCECHCHDQEDDDDYDN